ncbi:hypothetical protein RJT34_17980 [Clitoria ternatea]|uniref:Uncharacterized protein n=1 Tax=Clitoria ternatea TaxID=43366 RepID=A0AAN9J9Y8_CLITE
MLLTMAIALSGQLLLGQPVMVKPSEAEKNLVQPNTSGGAAGVAGPYGAVDLKLYMGNLHFNMTESQLRDTESARASRRQLKEAIYTTLCDMNIPTVCALNQVHISMRKRNQFELPLYLC